LNSKVVFQAIRNGFSLEAFLLPGLWSLIENLTFPFLLILLFNITILTLLKAISLIDNPILALVCSIFTLAAICFVHYYYGKKGNDWMYKHAVKKGFKHKMDIDATSSKKAKEAFRVMFESDTDSKV
jgi:hypothetical protein